MRWHILITIFLAIAFLSGCGTQESQDTPQEITRESKIPADAIKVSPENDVYPPLLKSTEYEQPVPLPQTINSAGGEDSAFVMSDGNTLYFWFTPSVGIPPEKQLLDGVTGIYVARKQNNEWGTPERVMLQDKGKLALDGCEFVQSDEIWFCSAREGYQGINLFTAQLKNGKWTDWQYAGEKIKDYEVGEMHLTADGSGMYFHSARQGGKGGYDIWFMEKTNGEWQEPKNIDVVNTPENDGWPFTTQDGNELWFTRIYMGSPAIFRSKKVKGEWQEPELIISQFAGEPSVDNQGNLYFTHHFYKDNKMIEADIYIAKKK
jgi:hypothetical protein